MFLSDFAVDFERWSCFGIFGEKILLLDLFGVDDMKPENPFPQEPSEKESEYSEEEFISLFSLSLVI